LLEADEAIARMVEVARAAFAAKHAMLMPEARKGIAFAAEHRDEVAKRRIVEIRCHLSTELGDNAARTFFPIADQLACGRCQKDVAQEIALTVIIEPADKELRCRLVPRACGPALVEQIGGTDNGRDGGDDTGGNFFGRRRAVPWIALAGEFEEVATLGAA